ncbi:hypothetical protein [Salana multivorans]
MDHPARRRPAGRLARRDQRGLARGGLRALRRAGRAVIAHAEGTNLDGTEIDGHDPLASPDGLAVGTEAEADDDAEAVEDAIADRPGSP